ncbi:uncharacterized protein LOC141910186 isoform X2 [Tubulanus polymorphus]
MIPAVTNDTINSPRSSPNPPPPQQQPPVMTRSRPPSPKQPSTSCNTGAAKSVPIHCIVEQMSSPGNADSVCPSQHAAVTGAAAASVELDSYAIIPCSTLFNEIVRSALMKLGYSTTESMTAKGAIQVKNWKPLSFEQITDNPEATVEDILSDLTTVATLRIRIYSVVVKTNAATADVKDKLLQLLLTQSQGLLSNLGCPIDKDLLNLISQGDISSANIDDDKRLSFLRWYNEMLEKINHGKLRHYNNAEIPPLLPVFPKNSVVVPASSPESSPSKDAVDGAANNNNKHSSSPAMAAVSIHKTRFRTSFDPDLEIPRLQQWFQRNQHPTRDQMLRYLHELNALESRRGRKPLDLTNIIYWFKNARAAQRRACRNLELALDDGARLDDRTCLDDGANLDDGARLDDGTRLNGASTDDGTRRADGAQHEFIDDNDNLSVERHSPISLVTTRHSAPPGGRVICNGDSDAESKSGGGGAPATTDSTIPELPNKNAVYVVNPLIPDRIVANGCDAEFTTRREEALDMSRHGSPTRNDKTPPPVNRLNRSTPTINDDDEKEDENGRYNDDDDDFSDHSNEAIDMSTGGARESTWVDRSTSRLLDRSNGDRSSSVDSSTSSFPLETKPDLNTSSPSLSSHSSPSRLTNGATSVKAEPPDDGGHHHRDNDAFKAAFAAHAHLTSAAAAGLSMVQSSLGYHHHRLHLPQNHPHHMIAPFYGVMSPSLLSHHHHHHHQHGHPHHHNNQPQQQQQQHGTGVTTATGNSSASAAAEERRKRTRVFIDPLSEIPKLEKWFVEDTHPTAYMIEKYCDELNKSEYRQRFPRLEPKNVQLWFKNHRAKVKRARLESPTAV